MHNPDSAPPVPGPAPPECRPLPLVDALRGIYRAVQKSAIYPSGHPSIPAAVEAATTELRSALGDRPHIVIGVTSESLTADDKRLTGANDGLRSMAQLLYQLDVGAVEIRAGVQPAELEHLAKLLGRARRERLRGATLARELEHTGPQHVVLHPIDYRLLRFGDGAQSEPGGDILGWLSRALTDAAAGDVEATLAKLASSVTESIARNEGAGLGALRQQLRDVVAESRGLADDRRAQSRKRLAAFLNALDANLRRDLLRVDVGNPGIALEILGEVGAELPLPEILEALHDLDQVGGRIPDEVLSLLNKLARSSPSTGTSTPIDRVRERWNARPTADAPIDARQAVAELFHRRTDADYNPDSYRRILEDLSTTTFEGEARISAMRYRDPWDPEDVRRHAAEIAVQLLPRSDLEEHAVSLLGYLRNATGFLVDVGDLGTLHEASLSARARSVLQRESETTRRAARELLDEFARPERIARILQHVRERGEAREEALGLLALGGAVALDAVLDELAVATKPELIESLRRFACERGGDALLRLLDSRRSRGRAALEPILAVTRDLPTAEAIPLLECLVEHDDERVRAEGLTLLCEIDQGPGSPERHLRRALCDGHQRILAIAIARLERLDSPEAVELLGEYVEFGIPDVAPQDSISARAAATLFARGAPGQERLATCLRRLARSVRIGRARQARRVAPHLRSATELPAARRALRAWNLSINRLVGVLAGDAERPGPGDAP